MLSLPVRSRGALSVLLMLFVLIAMGLAPAAMAQEAEETAQEAVGDAVEAVGAAAAAVGDAAVETAGAVAEGVENVADDAVEAGGDAVETAVSAIPTSFGDAAESTKSAVFSARDFLVSMGERFMDALPGVLWAVLFLLVAWILGRLVGWLVTSLLNRTQLDNRIARDLGLKEGRDDGSLERLIGSVFKWVIYLFGIVAFFNALNLEIVATPLSNVLSRITEAVPALLRAFAYLAVYWIVGSVLRLGLTRGLTAVDFDDRVSRWVKPREVKGEMVGPSGMIGRLVFWVVLLFGLPPFLEALGQQSAVAPLRNMMGEFFAFLPNVVGALILLFIGRIVATIVREVVVNFLAAAGADGLADRFGVDTATGGRRLSDVVGSIAYFFVLIPILSLPWMPSAFRRSRNRSRPRWSSCCLPFR